MVGSGPVEPTTPSKPYTSLTWAYSAKSSESSSGAARGAEVFEGFDLDVDFLMEFLKSFLFLLLSPSCMLLSLLTFMRASASLTMAKFFKFNLPGCYWKTRKRQRIILRLALNFRNERRNIYLERLTRSFWSNFISEIRVTLALMTTGCECMM